MSKLKNNLALLHLSACPFFGPRKIKLLEKSFHPLSDIFLASSRRLATAGLRFGDIENFLSWQKNFSLAHLQESLVKNGVNFVSWHDDDYPSLLLEIVDPPPILFYRGNLALASIKNYKFLAVIGSRLPSSYAARVLEELLPPLTSRIIIVSGLASGVDSLAHKQALATKGSTIAVLGSGLSWNKIYPRSNLSLAKMIVEENGLLLSEFLPDYPPRKENFPRRNRLISGLSQAVLIIEARKKSGSLITARHALEQGRDVWVVPGNIFLESSSGTNRLLQQGSWPILSAADIIQAFDLESELYLHDKKQILKTKTKIYQKYQPKNQIENELFSLITKAYQSGKRINAEEIARLSSLDTSLINSTLTILTLAEAILEKDGCFEPA